VLTQAVALALLAGALMLWPGPRATVRLKRALTLIEPPGPLPSATSGWARGLWPRHRGLRAGLAIAVVAALARVWPLAVVVVVVGVAGTLVMALVRGFRDRAALREERAAVEGLGILVAELRAGRPADDALATSARHCGHPVVGELLSRLGRSLRLGDRLATWNAVEGSRWQTRLIAGIRLSQLTGCALADVLATVESDLARHGSQRAELHATAAGHRATVALLAGLPILGLAMGSGIGAEPVRILTSTTVGHILLVVGVGLELLGLAWSRRMTSRALREG